jgi:molybdopterin adenylyltransferase
MAERWRVALIVLSDKAARGERADACLPAMRAGLPAPFAVVIERVLPDDRAALEAVLRELCDDEAADVILTSGGTGLSPRDITPQVTAALIDYDVPGIPEAMRRAGAQHVATAILSRAVAGVRRKTIIINLPGSPKAVAETLAVAVPVLAHACELLHGAQGDHAAQAHP